MTLGGRVFHPEFVVVEQSRNPYPVNPRLTACRAKPGRCEFTAGRARGEVVR